MLTPPHAPRVDVAPRIILSVPSLEQTYRTRSRYGPMGMSLRNTPTQRQSCSRDHGSRDVFVDEGPPRRPRHSRQYSQHRFLDQGYRNSPPISLNEQLRRSELAALQVGLNKPQGYVAAFSADNPGHPVRWSPGAGG
ncbi:hypothetical protein EVAR_86896_1 [Eumeta japonica]|uniref:Uncharacterized protein n=1 Tax=Eumeta variegata TaxID=151549 RepID=A0A4C1W933_EUMVA|nr:hypothetical protein EVAR_86896_1 [Eumeta japonica]